MKAIESLIVLLMVVLLCWPLLNVLRSQGLLQPWLPEIVNPAKSVVVIR